MTQEKEKLECFSPFLATDISRKIRCQTVMAEGDSLTISCPVGYPTAVFCSHSGNSTPSIVHDNTCVGSSLTAAICCKETTQPAYKHGRWQKAGNSKSFIMIHIIKYFIGSKCNGDNVAAFNEVRGAFASSTATPGTATSHDDCMVECLNDVRCKTFQFDTAKLQCHLSIHPVDRTGTTVVSEKAVSAVDIFSGMIKCISYDMKVLYSSVT